MHYLNYKNVPSLLLCIDFEKAVDSVDWNEFYDEMFKAFPTRVVGFEPLSLLNVPIIGQDDSILGVMQWLGEHVGQFDEHDEWVGPEEIRELIKQHVDPNFSIEAHA